MKQRGMESNHEQNNMLTIILCITVMLLNSGQAICVARNSSPQAPDSSPAGAPSPSPSPIASPRTKQIYSPPPEAETPSGSPSFSILRPLRDWLKGGDRGRSSPVSAPAPSPSSSAVNNPELKKICDTTDYPALCLASLAPFFNGRTDAESLLEMAIKASTEETKVVISASTNLESKISSDTVSTLRDCKENYNDALDNLQNALEALSSKDTGTINSMLSAAVTDYSTCDDEFNGQKNPMASYDEKLSNMASNCLAIASLIKE